MTDNELIELTKAYVALFNAHRVDLILSMFATGARYSSTATGEYRGRAAITDKMHEFFALYPDVNLQVRELRCDDHRVNFKFEMHANGTDGSKLERRGNEFIEFTAEGSIKIIEVAVD